MYLGLGWPWKNPGWDKCWGVGRVRIIGQGRFPIICMIISYGFPFASILTRGKSASILFSFRFTDHRYKGIVELNEYLLDE